MGFEKNAALVVVVTLRIFFSSAALLSSVNPFLCKFTWEDFGDVTFLVAKAGCPSCELDSLTRGRVRGFLLSAYLKLQSSSGVVRDFCPPVKWGKILLAAVKLSVVVSLIVGHKGFPALLVSRRRFGVAVGFLNSNICTCRYWYGRARNVCRVRFLATATTRLGKCLQSGRRAWGPQSALGVT